MKNTLDSRGARVHPGTMLAPDPHGMDADGGDDLRALGFGAVRGGGNGKGFEVTSELSPEVHACSGREGATRIKENSTTFRTPHLRLPPGSANFNPVTSRFP